MALHLKIENVPNLPDGGPVEITVTGKRGIDIGRDTHLDWTLPDPTRHISSKHAEIRYKEGGYWLHDVSTNGTFLNGSDHRMQAPHRLRNGDRFVIGHYIVAVALDGDSEIADPVPAGEAAPARAPDYQELWSMPGDAPPPIDPRQLKAVRDSSPLRPDFLDWAADVPNPSDGVVPSHPTRKIDRTDPYGDMDWARGASPAVPEPPRPPPIPAPRRPTAVETQSWEQASSEPMPSPRGPVAVEAPPWEPPRSDPRDNAAPERPAGRSARPPAAVPPASAGGGDIDEFVRALARAAGVSEQIFAGKDPNELAGQIGGALRIVVENLAQLLQARLQAKRLVRSTQHTVVQATDNNPLKFSPSTEEALRVMFGPSNRSYLDAHQALLSGFEDIKRHEIKTYSALQHALTSFLSELDPQVIDRETEADRGIAAVMASRKTKLWDAYVARWQAKQQSERGGLMDAFMLVFAKYYDDPRT